MNRAEIKLVLIQFLAILRESNIITKPDYEYMKDKVLNLSVSE